MPKSAIDKDLERVGELASGTDAIARAMAAPGIALVFIFATLIWAAFSVQAGPFGYLVVVATALAAYMALNIGANDIANNMGPAVGARALSMGMALALAAICEAAGAFFAGGDVVETISRDIIATGTHLETVPYVMVMIAALLASALWVNLATYIRAPVSTTHSVIGGIVGAGIAAAGFSAVVWPTILAIGTGWMVSPAVGGLFAALFLAVVQYSVLEATDRVRAARLWVPVFVSAMAGIFTAYMALKGLDRVWAPPLPMVVFVSLGLALLAWVLARPWIEARTLGMEDSKKQIGSLFRLPLIIAAALLSFAHGANDVSNAVGPLAAIVEAVSADPASTNPVPQWVLAIGALGIAFGLALFGPRLVRTVGEGITRLNEIRGYCVVLATATTVLIAAALGIPISSTHVAVGAIFGVGFFRERMTNGSLYRPVVSPEGVFLRTSHLNPTPEAAVANYHKRRRRLLVRRRHVASIFAAWIITVPATATLAAVIYAAMRLVFRL
ncbi:inorganic phosphate transporter [Pelagibacterium sp. 26DY04]|uniref:inorganic phosphate transporter n=1 Tax=Pelagibacterium sp. 26DY04 TaxID=2967130 RepID=UPI002814B437|nr:anion permease [Pelagibacterium sp. 26DY04]WMT87586.1 inorganic phosphate transporter [Pelagibacterium sp. 26DY04]